MSVCPTVVYQPVQRGTKAGLIAFWVKVLDYKRERLRKLRPHTLDMGGASYSMFVHPGLRGAGGGGGGG